MIYLYCSIFSAIFMSILLHFSSTLSLSSRSASVSSFYHFLLSIIYFCNLFPSFSTSTFFLLFFPFYHFLSFSTLFFYYLNSFLTARLFSLYILISSRSVYVSLLNMKQNRNLKNYLLSTARSTLKIF